MDERDRKEGMRFHSTVDSYAMVSSSQRCSYSTISSGHGIFVVPSLSSFSGSSDKGFTYVRLSPTRWESFVSASSRTGTNIWNITVTGVVEGDYAADLHKITDDTFFQRPALIIKNKTS